MAAKSGNTRAGNKVRGGARWMDEHVNDPYVKRAKAEGYRSRAAYKLIQIDQRDRILQRGQVVVDLGAAPGSWTQVAAARVGPTGRVIALDILPMDAVPGVTVIEGDFSADAALDQLVGLLDRSAVDVVLSDMAPNLSGIAFADQARAVALAELALEFAAAHLKPTGVLVLKVFQGGGFGGLLAAVRARFASVQSRKPDASRDRSAEMFLVARGLRHPPSVSENAR